MAKGDLVTYTQVRHCAYEVTRFWHPDFWRGWWVLCVGVRWRTLIAYLAPPVRRIAYPFGDTA